MQNSGEGTIYIIGWRGEPGVHNEPQHIFKGEITLKLLEDLDKIFHCFKGNKGQ